MVVSVNEALRRVGETFPFTWEGPLSPQPFGSETVTFSGNATLSGTYVYEERRFGSTPAQPRRMKQPARAAAIR